MANATCSANNIGFPWPSAWGSSGVLKIIADRDFVSNGKPYPAGRISDPVNQNFCYQSAITVVGNVATFAAITLPQTDAMDVQVINGTGSPQYTAIVYSNAGNTKRRNLFSGWHLSSSLGLTFNFAAWTTDNNAPTAINPRSSWVDTDTLNRALTAIAYAPASTTQLGLVKISTTPVDTASPIAVGDNDSRNTNARIPTGAAGGELAGTYPNPTVVTGTGPNQIVRLTAASKLPAVDGSLLINLPATSAYYLNVTDYGAKVDGVTDDTAAWNAALAAAYVLKVATIRMPGGISIVSSIVLPAYSSAGNEGISITIEGVGNPPVESGTFPGTLLTTSKASIIKSTTAGTAGVITQTGAPFQNVNLTFRNVVIRREDNPTGPGIDASNGFGVYFDDSEVDTGRYTTSIVQPTHPAAVGIKLPGTGNAGSLIIRGNTSIQGFYTGLLAGEHLVQSGDLKIGGCAVAIEFPAGYLALNFQRVNLFNCTTFFKYTGASYVLVQQMNIEHADSGTVGTPVWQDTVYDIDDAAKVGRGSIGVHITKGNVGVDSTFTRNGGNYIAVHQLMKLSAGVIRYSNNANISIPNNVDTGLSFNTSDLEGEWIVHSIVVAISRFTVKQSGNYIAGGEFDFALNATGTRLVYAKLNATTVIGKSQQDGSATYTRRIDLSTVPYFLEVGDYIEFYALQDSGGALNILAVTGSSPVGFLQRVQ